MEVIIRRGLDVTLTCLRAPFLTTTTLNEHLSKAVEKRPCPCILLIHCLLGHTEKTSPDLHWFIGVSLLCQFKVTVHLKKAAALIISLRLNGNIHSTLMHAIHTRSSF